MPVLLSVLAVLSLGAHLAAARVGADTLVFLFKPLTTLLIVALAWTLGSTPGAATRRGTTHPAYGRLIVAGLWGSLAGDVCLMLPGDWFVHGLVAFLVAHLCYIAAFTRRVARLRPGLEALPFAAAYVALVGRLVPHVGALLGPVCVYGAVLVAMAWCAARTWRVVRSRATALAMLGALSFVASDTLLAFGRFVPGAPRSEVAVMTTYIAAQLLIAWSIRTAPLHPCTLHPEP